MPVEDFYLDFARANFGEAAADSTGKLLASWTAFTKPQASDWKNGPGNLVPNPEPWSKVKLDTPLWRTRRVARERTGRGNLDRFDYWLNTSRATEAMAEACCLRGELDRVMAAKQYKEALKIRIDLACVWSDC